MTCKFRSTYNTILQYLQSGHKDDKGPCIPCGKMAHKESLDQRQNHL